MLLPLLIVPLVLRPVCPCLYPVPVLQIVPPVPLVLRAIDMRVYPVPVRLVVLPLPIEHVAVHMPELPFTMSLVVHPFALVSSSIWPHLGTAAVTDGALPLAFIDCAVLEFIVISVL